MKKSYQDFVYERHSNIIFSLHDSRIHKITFHNKTLTLQVDQLFQYEAHEEKIYFGEILFQNCDLDLCDILLFNKTLGEGHFTGKAISLQEFMDKYRDVELEVITEGYFGNTTTYTGWIWTAEKAPVSFILYIWNCGDMVYRIYNHC